jgi:phosphoglycolate phosphatase
MNLLLFDIDGTLLTTDGAGRLAMRQAAMDRFGVEEDLRQITIAGNTDGRIIRAVLEKHSIPVTSENIRLYQEGYLARLEENLLRTPGIVLPGVIDLLDAIETVEYARGLLTGNLERGARLKLGTHSLSERFEFGAFADDSSDRNELGTFAQSRAEALFRLSFDKQQVFVIGDTPRDIACGKSIGARTMAVATGEYSFEQLGFHGPDFLFEDFTSTGEVLAAFR